MFWPLSVDCDTKQLVLYSYTEKIKAINYDQFIHGMDSSNWIHTAIQFIWSV